MKHDDIINELTNFLEVFKTGRQMQRQNAACGSDTWEDCDFNTPGQEFPDFNTYTYRGKPEPREWWDVFCADTDSYRGHSRPGLRSFEAADDYVSRCCNMYEIPRHEFAIVHVREVLEDA